ncbi:MAG: hypothetical protein WKF72_12035 [Nocardioidaceae bacterium]
MRLVVIRFLEELDPTIEVGLLDGRVLDVAGLDASPQFIERHIEIPKFDRGAQFSCFDPKGIPLFAASCSPLNYDSHADPQEVLSH